MTLDDRLERWGGEQLLLRRDPCGATAIVAIHSTALGPARGGTRLRCYSSLDEAVDDALALAAAMTLKFAAVDFPSGGGKAVLAIPAGLGGEARRGLLLRPLFLTAGDLRDHARGRPVAGVRTLRLQVEGDARFAYGASIGLRLLVDPGPPAAAAVDAWRDP